MQFCLRSKSTFVIAATLFATIGRAATDTRTSTFAVLRNDDRIGTNTISVVRTGIQTTVEIVTHVAVRFAFLTVYRFDQTETEEWANGRLQSMNTTTDDNGTVQKTNVSNAGDAIVVLGSGQARKIATPIIPISLWNAALLKQDTGLNPKDGSIVPIKVTDRGEEEVIVEGRPMRARHYVITTGFSQDVWYDDNHRLVKVELKARDGSVIRYQLV
jgi:hypothetical protein